MRHPRTTALLCMLAMLAGVAHAQDRSDAERRLQGVRTELKQVAAGRRARRCQPQVARRR